MRNSLPDFFDAEQYRAAYPDVRSLSAIQARDHYIRVGIAEGRVATALQLRENFLSLLDSQLTALEIGPFTLPALRGPKVFYFDLADTDTLKIKAEQHKFPADDAPHIHFISPEADLNIVDRQFDQVFSSHCIEHQPNLIGHLCSVSKLLSDDGPGRLFLLIPDKRFCFDHFITPSTLADVIGAHVDGQKLHRASSVIKTTCMTTHNDAARHWAGDHGHPAFMASPGLLQTAYDIAASARGTYYDCHAWQFTPDSFAEIIGRLASLGMINLDVEQVYQTPFNRFEFGAVLRKRETIQAVAY